MHSLGDSSSPKLIGVLHGRARSMQGVNWVVCRDTAHLPLATVDCIRRHLVAMDVAQKTFELNNDIQVQPAARSPFWL
jgi:hypothetical protein